MDKTSYELFQKSSEEEIISFLQNQLTSRNESPFWAEKVIPFTQALLSVLIPLREQNLLFNPEGKAEATLTPELFFRWCDFVSLKSLAFTLAYSNESGLLVRTAIAKEKAKNYKAIEIATLASYLARYNVNLENESLDFPIATYNLHLGVANVIKSFL